MDFSNYLFRAHMVGKIIDVPKPLTPNQDKMFNDYLLRAKGEGRMLTENQQKELVSLQHKYNESQVYKLNDSTKKALAELAFAEKYKRRVEINSPYLRKGIEVEKDARDILTRVSGIFFTASEERKWNNWVTGAIDIEPDNVIIDIKSTFSWQSFCNILQDKPNEIYLRQGDSYMDLWNVKDFLLCHVLTDSPHKIIEGELRSYDYQNNILDMDGCVRDNSIDEVKNVVSNHIFSRQGLEEFCQYSTVVNIEWFNDFREIPEQERVHMVSHSFDKVRIEQRNECISLAREYMNQCKPINNFKKELLSA